MINATRVTDGGDVLSIALTDSDHAELDALASMATAKARTHLDNDGVRIETDDLVRAALLLLLEAPRTEAVETLVEIASAEYERSVADAEAYRPLGLMHPIRALATQKSIACEPLAR